MSKYIQEIINSKEAREKINAEEAVKFAEVKFTPWSG